MLNNRIPQERATRRERRGVSLIEVIVAMTLLAVTLGSLGLLSAKTAARARALDVSSARTFVLMQQSNRFSVLPYDSIPVYAPRTDTVISGRFKYARNVTYSQGTTGSEYRKVIVILTPLSGSTKPDSLVFQRAKIYAKSPLFT